MKLLIVLTVAVLLPSAIFSQNAGQPSIDDVKKLMSDLKELTDNKMKPLRDWVISHFNELKPALGNAEALMKKMAEEFTADIAEVNEDLAKQAKQFFENHKAQLGDAYQKVSEALKKQFPNI